MKAPAFHRKLALAACIASLGVVTVATAPKAVTRVLPLGSLRIVSTAQAQTASLTALATAVNTADQALASLQGQVIGWQLAGASFTPSLSQVTDPAGNVGYTSSKPYNAWVVLFNAPTQCGWSQYEGWVVVADDTDTPTYTTALATHPAVQAGNTCTLQAAGAVAPPAVPPVTVGTGPVGPGVLVVPSCPTRLQPVCQIH